MRRWTEPLDPVWISFTGRNHPRFGPQILHGPSGRKVGYRYRKAALRLEYRYASELLPRSKASLKNGRKDLISWEVVGLAADLREAGFEWTSISVIIQTHSAASLAHNVGRFFPEICDCWETSPPKEHPLRGPIEALIDQGWSNKAIAAKLHTTKGVVAGIRHRLGRKPANVVHQQPQTA